MVVVGGRGGGVIFVCTPKTFLVGQLLKKCILPEIRRSLGLPLSTSCFLLNYRSISMGFSSPMSDVLKAVKELNKDVFLS